MKTKIWMTAVLACVLLSACAGTVHTSRSASDFRGRTWPRRGWAVDVRIALLDKLGWDALDIDVEVDSGRARLTGEVDRRIGCPESGGKLSGAVEPVAGESQSADTETWTRTVRERATLA